MNIFQHATLTACLVPFSAMADRYVTNFDFALGGVASGVWKNDTTGIDTAIEVSLTHSNSVFDNDTVLDGTQEWPDPFGFNLFEPNYTEDAISLEVAGGATSMVVIDFGAMVVDPVLHFSDVDAQTTLVFSTANPVKVAGLNNMEVSGNSVTTDGTSGNPLDPTDVETIGSLKFFGSFPSLEFEIRNTSFFPVDGADRTAFSVSTEEVPVESTPVLPQLTVWQAMGHVFLSWPDSPVISGIEYTMNLNMGVWMPLPGVNTATMTDWDAPIDDFGQEFYVRLTYSF